MIPAAQRYVNRQAAGKLVGINTFTEGSGGKFGDIGGGVVLTPYAGWIQETMAVPEAGSSMFFLAAVFVFMVRRRRCAL